MQQGENESHIQTDAESLCAAVEREVLALGYDRQVAIAVAMAAAGKLIELAEG